MNNRKRRAEVAAETLQILEQAFYQYESERTSIRKELGLMQDGTRLYDSVELDLLIAPSSAKGEQKTKFSVVNCTTFSAAKRLVDSGFVNPLCLNFASAKNPGGGFLSGSQAQEECLARASGLYQSISAVQEYYQVNRRCRSSLYTNHLIYSPFVPVFRDDTDTLIDTPYTVSIITSPAVNAGAVRKNEVAAIPRMKPVMETRIRSVLAVAKQNGHNSLVLGAWGCGVFGNSAFDIAQWFAEALLNDTRYSGVFEEIIFAVYDPVKGAPTYAAFNSTFSEES